MKSLNAFGVHAPELGYGRFYLELAAALPRQGITVYDRMPGTEPLDWNVLNQGRHEGLAATVCWFSYPSHAPGWWEGQYSACFTMWETAYLPEAFRGVLDNYDMVIVPSLQNVELFSQWHPNVQYVPLGINPTVWRPTPRRPPERYFRFFTSGSGPRKGVDLAQKAFWDVFPDGSWGDGPIPTLQVKSIKGGIVDRPRLEVVSGRLSPADEINLYTQAHVYIQASRGEGFGLQPLQAIAQGVPTILTDAHGHKAFSHLGMGLSATTEHNAKAGGYFSFGEAGDWWEPSYDELCDWMLYCYEHYDSVCDDAAAHAKIAAETFTWDDSARQLVDVFPAGQLEADPPPMDKFRRLTQRLYRVRVDQVHQYDVGGISHRFEPGRDYWEPADLKRLLFDAGYLSTDCLLEQDNGLLPDQAERLDSYCAAKAYCPTCHQRLNSGEYEDA